MKFNNLKKIAVLFIATIVGCFIFKPLSSSKGVNLNEETARIQTVIESITTVVDLGRFDILSRFYAEEVVADYSSLWGGKPRTLTKDQIGPAWAGFIPGFDTTRHQITNIKVEVFGSNANATANITASHWLNNDVWVINGKYLFKLVKESEDWVVESWKFILKSEFGDRSLVDIAEKRIR